MDGKVPDTADVPQRKEEQVPESSLPSIDRLRSDRIDDYQREVLADGDAFKACLGAANGQLLRFGLRIEQHLEAALKVEGRGDLQGCLSKLMPGLEAHLKVMRQVDRFAHLVRARQDRK